MTEMILVFSTGRSGTALLAQYFGKERAGKRQWNFRDAWGISHEPFDHLKEYADAIAAVKRGEKKSLVSFLEQELRSKSNCRKFLITDNKLGRWFFDDAKQIGVKVKIIYLHRKNQDVVKSIERTSRQVGMEWCYETSDHSSLTDRSQSPHWYHVKETAARWRELKSKLQPDDYIEISFERFIDDRKVRAELETFVGLEGFEESLSKKINYSLPFMGGKYYGRYFDLVRQKISQLLRRGKK